MNAKEIMKALAAAATLALALAFVHLGASASPELAQKRTCMACHAVDRKIVGPSYKDVSAKYAGQREAIEVLAVKIAKGGSGVWGAVPMPANPQVTPAEARALAIWILGMK
jgi:cytochrome c